MCASVMASVANTLLVYDLILSVCYEPLKPAACVWFPEAGCSFEEQSHTYIPHKCRYDGIVIKKVGVYNIIHYFLNVFVSIHI